MHVELLVLVMDSQNALDFVTRALTLSARTLMDSAARHQQETVKLVRPVCQDLGLIRAHTLMKLTRTGFDTDGGGINPIVVRMNLSCIDVCTAQAFVLHACADSVYESCSPSRGL